MSELDRIQDAYRRRTEAGGSDTYHYENPAFLFHMQERERLILGFLKSKGIPLKGARVLEVGCGSGHILDRFMEFGAGEAYGVDLMLDRVKAAHRDYSRIHVTQGDASRVPFADDSFDVVMQFMCISSVLEADMRKRIAAEMWRVTRPGGAVLSFDLRGRTWPLRFLYACRRAPQRLVSRALGRTGANKGSSRHTPLQPIGSTELATFFPGGTVHKVTASLDFPLAKQARRSFLIAYLLSKIPFLRSNYLALVKKPLRNT